MHATKVAMHTCCACLHQWTVNLILITVMGTGIGEPDNPCVAHAVQVTAVSSGEWRASQTEAIRAIADRGAACTGVMVEL